MKKQMLGILLLLTLLLTGCVEMEVLSTIRTDGTASIEIEQAFVMTEEEWSEMEESGTSVVEDPEEDIETLRNIDGVTSVDYILLDEVNDGIIKKGTRYIIEINNLESYGEVFEELLGTEMNVVQQGSNVDLSIDYSLINSDDQDDMLGMEIDIKAYMRFNIEGEVTKHNATRVSGPVYEWDETFSEDMLFISFNNEATETPQEAVEDVTGGEEQDVVEEETETNLADTDESETIKLIVLGLMFAIILGLSTYAFILSKKEL